MSRSAKNGAGSKKTKNRKFPKKFNFWPRGVAHRLAGRGLDETDVATAGSVTIEGEQSDGNNAEQSAPRPESEAKRVCVRIAPELLTELGLPRVHNAGGGNCLYHSLA